MCVCMWITHSLSLSVGGAHVSAGCFVCDIAWMRGLSCLARTMPTCVCGRPMPLRSSARYAALCIDTQARTPMLMRTRLAYGCAQLVPRERAALEYNEALKERYKHVPEVKRIARYGPAATGPPYHAALTSAPSACVPVRACVGTGMCPRSSTLQARPSGRCWGHWRGARPMSAHTRRQAPSPSALPAPVKSSRPRSSTPPPRRPPPLFLCVRMRVYVYRATAVRGMQVPGRA
jgi:hypothetical protein